MQDAIIVGAGLSGAVMAERLANELGWSVLVIDKRDHIGGNVYDEYYPGTNIRVARYGPHFFHTNDPEVWQYVNRFGSWTRWDHKVLARCSRHTYVPVPVNINTVNSLYGANLSNSEEFQAWMTGERQGLEADAKNSKDVALARVGPRLYEKLFMDYTLKQWGVPAEELDPLVLKRIPVRDNFDDRYFTDKYQAMPTEGYTKVIEKMLSHPLITVRLNCDYSHDLVPKKLLIYTGPIDAYFKDAGLPPLQYRSLTFEPVVFDCQGYVQPAAVVSYPNISTSYTRSTEYKHILHQQSDKSVVIYESSSESGEPYYPMPTKRNQEIYAQYQALALQAEAQGNVKFLGRLATYKYINMDQAIRLALDLFKEVSSSSK